MGARKTARIQDATVVGHQSLNNTSKLDGDATGNLQFPLPRMVCITNQLSFPLIVGPVKLTFSSKYGEFFDGPEALFRRRHLKVAA